MNIAAILSAIDQEISRLEQARSLLRGVSEASFTSTDAGKRRGRPPGKAKPAPARQARVLSEEGRSRIAAAQKTRWAAKKKADQKAAKAAVPVADTRKTVMPAKKQTLKKKKLMVAVLPRAEKKTAVGKSAPPKKKTAAKTPVSQHVEQTEPQDLPVTMDQALETNAHEEGTSAE